jgi:hypothetical protein
MTKQKHHPYGPSTLPRLFACNGSPVMCEGQPELEDKYSGLGNDLHAATETGDLSGIDDDDKEIAVACLDALTSIAPLDRWQREVELDLIHDDQVVNYGTADAVLVEFDSAIVVDWKFGYIPVTACEDNWQMRCYAAMVMQEYDVDTVQAFVVQPRIKQQTEACWTRAELEQFVVDIKNCIDSIAAPGCQLAAGDHCNYCKAKPICPEHRRQFAELVQTSNKEIDCPAEIAKRLELGALAKKWYDSIRHRAEQFVFSGGEIPGYYMQTRQGKAVIDDANAAYQALVVDGVLTHEQFMDEVELTVGKLEDKYSRQMKLENGQTLKEGKEFFYSQPWVSRGSDTQVLTKSRKKKDA